MTKQSIDEYRRAGYELSQAIAPGWRRRHVEFEAAMTPVRELMVAGIAAGGTVLELAAGAGDTGFAASAVARRLICTDFSPAMLDVARGRAGELGVRNVEFSVMDAERLELDSASVDAVLCRFGYMLMADPAAALSETRRVLRAGGRLALAVWAAPERNPFFAVLASVLARGGHVAPPPAGAPNPFGMADPDRTGALLEVAGFTAIALDEIPVRFPFRDVDGYLGFMGDTAGPLAVALQALSGADREDVARSVGDALGAFAVDGGYAIPGAALVATARPAG